MSTAGPAHRVQSAVEDYGYPRGHLGHLSPDEEAAFTNFKNYVQRKDTTSLGTEKMTIPVTMIRCCCRLWSRVQRLDLTNFCSSRFLRARRFSVQDAFGQFKDTEDWRKANELDKLYETIDLEHYEETRRLVRYSASAFSAA